MKFKLIAISIIFTTVIQTLHIQASACKLATQEDIQALKESRGFNTNWPKELNDHFKVYRFEHDDCTTQISRCAIGRIVSAFGTLLTLKQTVSNSQSIIWSLCLATIYTCTVCYMDKEVKKINRIQEELTQDCSTVFDTEDLECLQTWLNDKTNPELHKELDEEQIAASLNFLDKVLKRKVLQ